MLNILAFPLLIVVPSRLLKAFVGVTGDDDAKAALKRISARGIDLNSWLPPLFNVAIHQEVSDKTALDAIATAMSNEEWNADLWNIVRDLVTQTGREISDVDNDNEMCMCGKPYTKHRVKDLACPVGGSMFNDAGASFKPKPKVQ